MLPPIERRSIHEAYGINHDPSGSGVIPLHDYKHPLRSRLKRVGQQVTRHPVISVFVTTTTIVSGGAAAGGVPVLGVLGFSNQNTIHPPTEHHQQIEVAEIPISYDEILPDHVRSLLLNRKLGMFVERLPAGSTATLAVFASEAKGLVQPNEGLIVRELPTREADKASPYGFGHMQEVAYTARFTMEIPKANGIIRYESWAVLKDGNAFAAISMYDYGPDGKIFPASMNLLLVPVEPAIAASYTLYRNRT